MQSYPCVFTCFRPACLGNCFLLFPVCLQWLPKNRHRNRNLNLQPLYLSPISIHSYANNNHNNKKKKHKTETETEKSAEFILNKVCRSKNSFACFFLWERSDTNDKKNSSIRMTIKAQEKDQPRGT